MKPIGLEIRRLRDSMGMTLMEFGALVGVPWQSVHGYETGRMIPPSDRLLLIVHKTRGAKRPFQLTKIAKAVAAAAGSGNVAEAA